MFCIFVMRTEISLTLAALQIISMNTITLGFGIIGHGIEPIGDISAYIPESGMKVVK